MVVVVTVGIGVPEGIAVVVGRQTVQAGGGAVGVAAGCTDVGGSVGTADGVGSVTTARVVAGLSSSATNPRSTTVAAMAPRRAALIGRTAAERVSGTSPEEVELYRDAVPRRVQSVAP
ncbi:MAG TPA: hypothetical protein VGL20_14545, partial [Candidatus Dormibacteraeota bacterium]